MVSFSDHAGLRRCLSEPPARRSHTEVEATMLAFGVGLDIDAQEHQRRKIVGDDRRQPSGNSQVLPNVDVSHSWDLPIESLGGRPVLKAGRRAFWEQTHWADQWAKLLDRPRRGNRNSAWLEEVPPKLETWDDLPDDAQARLREIKCDLEDALAKKHGRPKTRGTSARPATTSPKESPVPKIWDALYDAPWRDSFLNTVDEALEGKAPGSSRASTASGDALVAPSPDVNSSPGTARSLIDSESDDGVFHIVNDPKGKHALLHQAKDDRVAASCQRMELPLGLRRVLCAVVPADPEASLQLSGFQMRKLCSLRGALRTQRQGSTTRSAPRLSKRPTK